MSIAEKLQTIAENEQKVYEAGKKAEYDAFWDSFQQNGERTYYYMGFGGNGWNDETFRPKYNIGVVGNAGSMFAQSLITNLKGILNDLEISLDLSQATGFSGFVGGSSLTDLGVVDTRGSSSISGIFSNANYIESVEKLILKDDGSQTTNDAVFERCYVLENIVIEGKIGNNINFAYPNVGLGAPKLSKDSLLSIINALKDYTGTGTTKTCKLGSTNSGKLTDAEKAIATQKGWTLA